MLVWQSLCFHFISIRGVVGEFADSWDRVVFEECFLNSSGSKPFSFLEVPVDNIEVKSSWEYKG